MEVPDLFLGALPDDDVLREAVAYGGARHPPSGGSEVQVRVHWAAVRGDGRFGENCPVVSRWIGCGQLAIVPLGSRWRRRWQVDPPFRPVSTATAICVGTETIGRSKPRLGDAHQPFDLEPDTRCFCLELDGDPKKIALVPVLEVIRAVFGCRSGFLRQVFDGKRDPALMRRRFLFDPAKSKREGRTVKVFGHSKPTEREAWLAATMVASDVFKASHDNVRAKSQVAGGYGGAKGVPVDTSFPFADDAPVGLAFESRLVVIQLGSQAVVVDGVKTMNVMRRTVKRTIITRIRAFESVSSFDVVKYSWPRFVAQPDLPPRNDKTLFFGRRSIVLVDDVSPGTLRATLRLGQEGADALAATGVIFVSEPRILGETARSGTSVEDGSSESRGSTADARSQGDDDVIPVEIEARDAAGDPGMALGLRGRSMIATDSAVRRLGADRGWPVDGLADAPGLKPPVWPFGSGGSMLHIVEMVVHTAGGPVLVYEAGSTPKDKRALGFVAKVGMGPFLDDDLRKVRERIVEWRAHWLGGRRLGGFVVAGLTRPEVWWNDTPAYAGHIAARIDGLVKAASVP